jgi:hypothetical protein
MLKKGGIPPAQCSGSDATDRLRETIIELDKTTRRYTKQLVCLTWAIAAMTLTILIFAMVMLAKPP